MFSIHRTKCVEEYIYAERIRPNKPHGLLASPEYGECSFTLSLESCHRGDMFEMLQYMQFNGRVPTKQERETESIGAVHVTLQYNRLRCRFVYALLPPCSTANLCGITFIIFALWKYYIVIKSFAVSIYERESMSCSST